LFGIRHKTQNQFPGQESPQESFCIPEVVLAPFRRTIGVRLRQMELAEVRFQLQPDRLPVLRRGLHHDLLDSTFPQPSHQVFALAGRGSKATTFPLLWFHPRRIPYHYHQHLLVNIDSCYRVGHCFPSGEEAAERAAYGITHPYVLMLFLFGRATSHLSVQKHVPDQTSLRPRPIQSGFDLFRSSPLPTLSHSRRFSSLLVSRRPMETSYGRGSLSAAGQLQNQGRYVALWMSVSHTFTSRILIGTGVALSVRDIS
jgi:hypothetical protein